MTRPLFAAAALALFALPASAQLLDSARHSVLQAGMPLGRDLVVAEPHWDLNVRSYEDQGRVQHYVDVFTGRARQRVTEWLERGSRYEPMIRSALHAGGVPEDMYYLALVESGFDQHAYSKAAAVGMWQFMASTARGMGMRVDWWVDERRDPVRSTNAAVKLLRELRDQFNGSLYLAAAAYNGGTGRVSRGVSKYASDLEGIEGDDRFFVLADKDYLKKETREYVPQLIAAALIAKSPARYNMEWRAQPAFVYDSVVVPAATPLAAIASASGSSLSEIRELNPHLLRGMTAPKEAMMVRVPAGRSAGFDSLLNALPKTERVGFTRMESQKGDSPEKLARVSGIRVTQLKTFNPKLQQLKSGRLVAGQTVLIPTLAVANAALSVPDPSIERYPKKAKHAKTKVGASRAKSKAATSHKKKSKTLSSKKHVKG